MVSGMSSSVTSSTGRAGYIVTTNITNITNHSCNHQYQITNTPVPWLKVNAVDDHDFRTEIPESIKASTDELCFWLSLWSWLFLICVPPCESYDATAITVNSSFSTGFIETECNYVQRLFK
jgi:hypothetical protein